MLKGVRMIRSDSHTMMRSVLRWLVFAVLTVGSATAHCAGVAMVTDLQGKAALPADGKARDVTILAELAAGTRVDLDSGATMVALYIDTGDEYIFKGPAQIVFRPGQPEVVKGAAPQKRGAVLGMGGKDIRIKPVGVTQGAIVMRSAHPAARIKLLTLSGTKTLETQPEFKWQELQPGLTYQFEISDDSGRALQEAKVTGTTFKLAPNVTLVAGANYMWEVSTRLPNGLKYSTAGDFSIAPPELRAQAEVLRPAASAALSTRVAYAAWLDQMELKDEARKYWRALSAERPDDARLKALAAE